MGCGKSQRRIACLSYRTETVIIWRASSRWVLTRSLLKSARTDPSEIPSLVISEDLHETYSNFLVQQFISTSEMHFSNDSIIVRWVLSAVSSTDCRWTCVWSVSLAGATVGRRQETRCRGRARVIDVRFLRKSERETTKWRKKRCVWCRTLSVVVCGEGKWNRWKDWIETVLSLSSDADEGVERSEPPETIVDPLLFVAPNDSSDTWDGNRGRRLNWEMSSITIETWRSNGWPTLSVVGLHRFDWRNPATGCCPLSPWLLFDRTAPN